MNFYIATLSLENLSSEPFHPTTANSWEGFQVLPTEAGVDVAVKSLNQNAHQLFNGTDWQDSPDPVYYTPTQIRESIKSWAGGVQFLLRYKTVKPEQVKVGFWSSKSVMGYLTRFALLDLLKASVTLEREIFLQDGLGDVVIPPGLETGRIKKLLVAAYDRRSQLATVDEATREIFIPKPFVEPIPGEQIRLLMDYAIRVEAISPEGLYQVEEYPTVVVRIGRRGVNVRLTDLTKETIAVGEKEGVTLVRTWSAYQESDRPISIRVIAQTPAESQSIAGQLIGRISEVGYLSAPPWNMNFGMIVVGTPELTEDTQVLGGLATTSFEVWLLSIPEGEQTSIVCEFGQRRHF